MRIKTKYRFRKVFEFSAHIKPPKAKSFGSSPRPIAVPPQFCFRPNTEPLVHVMSLNLFSTLQTPTARQPAAADFHYNSRTRAKISGRYLSERPAHAQTLRPRTRRASQFRPSGGFYRVSAKRRCRICDHDNWCVYARDERTSICMRNGDGAKIGRASCRE